MDFQQTWRKQIQERLAGFAPSAQAQFQQAAPNLLYGFLSAMALWPVAQAVQGGELAALVALGSVAGGVGANLIANQVQSWRDEADAAEQLSQAAQDDPDVREALDVLLINLDIVEQAQAGMSDQDRAWFLETLRREVARLGSSLTVVTVTGSGAAAVGEQAAAAGEGGVAVIGDIQGDLIAPGAKKVEALPSVAEQQEQAVARYLHNLRRLCNALPLAALAEGEGPHRRAAITLNRVYIALNITTEIPLTEEEQTYPRLPALKAADRETRLVILGDPGSGKSTFVNYLAYVLAGVWRGEGEVPEGWSHGALLPIRVVLRELVGYLPEAGELQKLSAEKRIARLVNRVWEYLHQELATYRVGEALEILEREVDRGRALVIFDGLDEVAPERRGVVREAVEAFCQQCDEKSRVLVTCRTRSYQEARLSAFADVALAPFATGQIDDFVGRWYQALADLGTLTLQEAERRAENLRTAVHPLVELARNPLLLTTMAVVHTAQVELPRERARLYQRCVDVLLRRWHKHKAGEVPLLNQLGVSESKLLAALWEVAYQAHQRGGTGEEGDLPRSEVLRVLAGHLGGKYGLAEQFLDYVDARAGLLVGQGGIKEPVYAFPHRTFQEYLAGCHLALGGRDFGRRLRVLLEEGDRWALAAQLGAEHLLYNVGDVTKVLDAAYTLCPVAEPGREADWRGVLWAGLFAAEIGRRRIEEDTESPDGEASFLERLVSRLVKILEEERLSPVERAAAGDALARLGDPRPGVGLREDGLPDVVWCEVPAGPFVMGTQKQDISALMEKYGGDREWYELETPQHKPNLPAYSIGKYLVTNAQYAAFVMAGGYQERRYWTKAGWEWKKDRTGPDTYGGVFDLPNHPVVMVTWYEAVAFCRWLTERLREAGELGPNQEVALPTEAQWEKAARGDDGRIFPWGNEFDPAKCNMYDTGIGSTSAVGMFQTGASPHGVLDMSGNVWEWCRTKWRYSYEEPADESLKGDVLRVLRSGPWNGHRDFVHCVGRWWYLPYSSRNFIGFRLCVVSLEAEWDDDE
jgi:formylglycine-generating enzyme required for sulfatase activity